MNSSRSVYVKMAAAALALAAAGAAPLAHARSDVYFSVGANVAPGVSIGVSNAPVYYPPVYGYAAPVYAPAPVVVAAPAYYGYGYGYARPIVVPAPVFYGPGWRHHRRHRGRH